MTIPRRRARTLLTSAALLLTATALAACFTPRLVPGRDHDTVQAKQPPSTLLATSGRTCLVDPITYNNTRVGMSIPCSWSSTSTTQRTSDMVAATGPTDPRAGRSGEETGPPWWWPFGRRKK